MVPHSIVLIFNNFNNTSRFMKVVKWHTNLKKDRPTNVTEKVKLLIVDRPTRFGLKHFMTIKKRICSMYKIQT